MTVILIFAQLVLMIEINAQHVEMVNIYFKIIVQNLNQIELIVKKATQMNILLANNAIVIAINAVDHYFLNAVSA